MPGPVRRAPVASSAGISTIRVPHGPGIPPYRWRIGPAVAAPPMCRARRPPLRPDQRRAGVEGDPAAQRLGVVGRREVNGVVPSQSVRISAPAAGEQGAGGAAPASVSIRPGRLSACKRTAKGVGGLAGRVRETAIECLRVITLSPRTMVKNSTFVAAALAARDRRSASASTRRGRGWPPPAPPPPPPRRARRSGRRPARRPCRAPAHGHARPRHPAAAPSRASPSFRRG
jgi:hypothetical protein